MSGVIATVRENYESYCKLELALMYGENITIANQAVLYWLIINKVVGTSPIAELNHFIPIILEVKSIPIDKINLLLNYLDRYLKSGAKFFLEYPLKWT